MDKKFKKEVLSENSIDKNQVEFLGAQKEDKERIHETSPEEIQKIREEIEKTDLDDHLKIQAWVHAQNIKHLKGDEKIKKLLEIANKKGVIYAISVAKKIGNSYILDIFHDVLVKNGYYKKFKK